jgi:antitoxin (DNA-binding transcriptional repressor) of toxin-antitoxin stability system
MAAGTYSISLDLAQRAAAQAGQEIAVLVNGQVVGEFTPASTNFQQYSTASFSLAAGTYPIELLGLNPHGGDNTALVDQLSVVVALGNEPVDPGFELPGLAAGAFQYSPTGSPWTFAGGAGVAANGSGFTYANPSAPQGAQVAFIQGTGSVSQSLDLSAGTYSISLELAQRAFKQAGQEIEVLVDGQEVSEITPSGTSYQQYNTATFTVSSGMHTIELLGLDPNSGDNTALVDSVFMNWE